MALLPLGAVAAIRAQTAPPKPAAAATVAAIEGPPVASPLSAQEQNWIEDVVAPLASRQETSLYESLPSASQRAAFAQEFWRIRELPGLTPPLGPGFEKLFQNRYATAEDKYGGVKSDAGRAVLQFGKPQKITTLSCPVLFRPLEIWTIPEMAGQNTVLKLIFYRDADNQPLKLWTPKVGADALLSPAQSGIDFSRLLAADCASGQGRCSGECELRDAFDALTTPAGEMELEAVASFTHFPVPPQDSWAAWMAQHGAGMSAAQEASIVAESPKQGPAASPAQRLNGKQRKALHAALPEKYRQWLNDVGLIITDPERDVFLQIKDDIDRDEFIDEFWRRRSVDKDGLHTNFKERYMVRLEYAKEHFRNLDTDAAKIYLINGPPDAIIPVECEDLFVPIQVWYYERIEALKSKVYLIFYRPYGMEDWTLWSPIDNLDKLSASGMMMSLQQAGQTCYLATRTLQDAMNYELGVLGQGAMGMLGVAKLMQPPAVQTEGIDRFLGMTTQLSAGAAPLHLSPGIIYPASRDGKMACDISLQIPRRELAIRTLGTQKFYDVDLIGEVIENDHLLENFKYRFDIPIDEAGEKALPLTIRRYLYPGSYELRLKASDANHSAEGRLTQTLTVPDHPTAPEEVLATLRAAGAAPDIASTESDFRPSAISILQPVKDVLTGVQRFETNTAQGITAVDFYLDNSKTMTRTQPPFDADLNLGPLPRKHTIRAVAYDVKGRDVGEDELTINAGSEAFLVKIISPQRGTKVSGPTMVVADATAPEGRHIEKMDFYANETKIATLYQKPWQQLVPVRKTQGLGYIRVVGTLDDGLVAEDLRYVNAPKYLSNVNVDAVELYTTVTEHSRPVRGLTEKNFHIIEDGQPQQIAQFEYVTDTPLSLGLVIDTSASMIDNLAEAEQGAVGFLNAVLTPKDRAFTMSFDESPYVLCRLTSDRSKLESSFAGLRAEGSTALYDALVYGLFQFQGVRGKKALVVLTDGMDNSSHDDFDTLLDYVKKAGVSIYGIGLNISGSEIEVKSKLNRLAEASGGTTFYIKNVKSLPAIYKQIDDELRSQYQLTYYSTNTEGNNKWRTVDVKMTPSGLTARTISGYYP